MIKFSKILAICFSALLIGCGSVIQSNELSGDYQVSYQGDTEKLIIRPDGTYEQTLLFKGKIYSTTGTWTYYPDKKNIRFTNPMEFARSINARDYQFRKESTTYDDTGQGRGFWQVRPVREDESISIKLHDDTSLRFKKIKN